ncbi:MAG: HNH endonuclease [Candidatus Dormibacteria bacterium]
MTAADRQKGQGGPKWPPPTRRELYDQTVGVDGPEKLAVGLAESLAARDVADLAVQRAQELVREAPADDAALTAARKAGLAAQRARWQWEDWASVAADHQRRAEKLAAQEQAKRLASAASVLCPWVAAHPRLNASLAGVLVRIPNVPGPWRADPGASWDFGQPLPDYPGATFDSRHKVWLIPPGGWDAGPRSGHTVILSMGRTVHVHMHSDHLEEWTETLPALWAEGEKQPPGSESRLKAILQVRGRARLARAKGACEALAAASMSDRRRSQSVQGVSWCWSEEHERAKRGLYVRYPPSQALRQEVMARFEAGGRLCEWCGRKVGAGAATHIDHIIAYAHGGLSEAANLRVLHARCNMERNALENGFR